MNMQLAKVTGWGAHGSSITISNLAHDEASNLEAMVHGQRWVRFLDGRLVHQEVSMPLPPLEADRLLAPFFVGERQLDLQGKPDFTRVKNVVDLVVGNPNHSYDPSFIIQHIDAGLATGRSTETYLKAASTLDSWGFEVLRSRRGKNGRFWELWFLPGLWCATGELAAAIKPFTESDQRSERLRKAIKFLASSTVPFATLDVCSQRLAITFD